MSWPVTARHIFFPPNPCPDDLYAPFDHVRLTRVRDDAGEPTDWVSLEALRDGGERSVTVRYQDLWQQMDTHVQLHHGKSLDDPHTFADLEHATIRAAVAFLMD